MYDENFKISSRYANSTRAFVNAAIENFNEGAKTKPAEDYKVRYQDEADVLIESAISRNNLSNKYKAFSESLKNTLVIEGLYRLFKESVTIPVDVNDLAVMRAMVGQYVTENGYDNVLRTMKTASAEMSNLHNVIISSTNAFMENVDNNDPSTFVVTPEMKDEFFKKLDYNDLGSVTDAIKDRVSDATKDFIDANVADHKAIEDTLQSIQDKIATIDDENTELKEFYEMKARRQINSIRSGKKNVLHKMIYAMSETVMRNSKEYSEFMEGDHINMDKVVNRTTLMYTFMEMLNTARIAKVDKAFIENVIQDLGA